MGIFQIILVMLVVASLGSTIQEDATSDSTADTTTTTDD